MFGITVCLYAQTASNEYKTTFSTMRMLFRSNDGLKQEILNNQLAGPLTPTELARRQAKMKDLVNQVWNKKELEIALGDVVLRTAKDAYPPIKTLLTEFKDILPKPVAKAVDVLGKVENIKNSMPQYSKDFLNENVFKYFSPDYYVTERQKGYDEMLELQFPSVLATAIKENPQNPNIALNNLRNQIQNPQIQAKFDDFVQKNQGKTFSVGKNLTFEQASQNLIEKDKRVVEHNKASADVYAEYLFNEQMQYHVAEMYSADISTLKQQATNLQRDLRNTNLTQQQILVKQKELQSVVYKLGASLSGFEKATDKRLGSIEEKLNKYGTITKQLLLEIKLEKTPLDERIKIFEDMKADAEAGRVTPYSLSDINKLLDRDKELKQVEKKKQNLAIAQEALEYGRVALAYMEEFNIGSEKDRKYVATGLAVAEIGVRAYGGDYAGAAMGVLSLLKKPKPTPEMQMLMQINERLAALEQTIDEGFRGLHDHLTSIHQDLVNRLDFISSQMSDMRMQMMKNHQEVVSQLYEINENLEKRLQYLTVQNQRIDEKLTALLGGSTDVCFEPQRTWSVIKDNSDADKLTPSYLNSFVEGSFCRPCFDALLSTLNEDFVQGNKKLAFDYTIGPVESQYQSLYNQLDLFNKQVEFWNSQFTANTTAKDTAVSAMIYPTVKVTEHNLPYGRLKQEKVKPILSAYNTYTNERYMNYKRVVQFSNYIFDFYNLLEVYKNNRIMNATEVNADLSFLQFRSNLLENGAKKVLNLIEKSIAQESLMMGIQQFDLFFDILNSGKYSSDELTIGPKTLEIGRRIEEVFKILRSNPVMAHNFASYLMTKTVQTNAVFEANLKKYDDGIKKAVDFEGIIPLTTAQWMYMSVDKDGLGLGIQKQYLKSVGGTPQLLEDHVYLPLVRDEEPIFENDTIFKGIKEVYVVDRMVPTEGMMALQEAREKIKSIIVEVNILKGVTVNDQENGFSTKDLQFLALNDIMLEKAYNDTIAVQMPKKCDLEINLTSLNNITTGSYPYESGRAIIATNKILGGKVTYDAGKTVTLNPGFEALGNATVFKAFIDGCGNN